MVADGYRISKKDMILYAELGDCPNLELPTNGGGLLWEDARTKNGWRLQHNYFTGLSRILDSKNVRKAWGSPVIMEEKFKRLTRKEFLESGDVVGIVRKKVWNLYEHYGVYIGNGKVVHYSGMGTDFKGNVCVQEDTLEHFLKEDKDYFVLYFDKSYVAPRKIQVKTEFNLDDMNLATSLCLTQKNQFKLYSPQETVKRALSRVGEEKYDLLFNNCEHFAVWCKTGISESYQVERVFHALDLPQVSF